MLSITNNSIKHQTFVNTQLYDQTVLFQTIQFSIGHLFALSLKVSFIWPIDRILSCTTTPGQSGPGSDGNEKVLHILQRSSITGVSPSDGLMSYPGHSLEGGGLTPLQTMQSVDSTAPANRAHLGWKWLIFWKENSRIIKI